LSARIIGCMSESQGPGIGGDATNYSWPPFTEGNTVSLRHGARSDRFVEPLARAFLDVLVADRPDLLAYPEVLAAWATAEARCERLRTWQSRRGFVDDARGGFVRRMTRWLSRSRRSICVSGWGSIRWLMRILRRREAKPSCRSLILSRSGLVAGRFGHVGRLNSLLLRVRRLTLR